MVSDVTVNRGSTVRVTGEIDPSEETVSSPPDRGCATVS